MVQAADAHTTISPPKSRPAVGMYRDSIMLVIDGLPLLAECRPASLAYGEGGTVTAGELYGGCEVVFKSVSDWVVDEIWLDAGNDERVYVRDGALLSLIAERICEHYGAIIEEKIAERIVDVAEGDAR
jgi:hypothetical protein